MSGPSAGAGTGLEEIEARLETLTHLEGIVNAMRGIVNLRLREALERLDGIRAYASTVGTAIGEVLTLAPPPPAPPRPPQAARLVIAIAGEQSFTGAFTRRIVERAASLLRGGGEAGPGRGGEVLLVGSRGLRIAGELGLDVAWAAPMSARIDDIPSLADRLAAALYERVAEAGALTVLLVHAVGRSGIAGPDEGASVHGQGSLRVQRLLPFDFGRFPPRPAQAAAPRQSAAGAAAGAARPGIHLRRARRGAGPRPCCRKRGAAAGHDRRAQQHCTHARRARAPRSRASPGTGDCRGAGARRRAPRAAPPCKRPRRRGPRKSLTGAGTRRATRGATRARGQRAERLARSSVARGEMRRMFGARGRTMPRA